MQLSHDNMNATIMQAASGQISFLENHGRYNKKYRGII
jgi:hypothetical protein